VPLLLNRLAADPLLIVTGLGLAGLGFEFGTVILMSLGLTVGFSNWNPFVMVTVPFFCLNVFGGGPLLVGSFRTLLFGSGFLL